MRQIEKQDEMRIGPMDVERKAVLVGIEGRVQGVGFRVWARSEAEALGLAGWVRNEADGSVKARIEGRSDSVDRMLERLRLGPPGGAVTNVTVEAAMPEDTGDSFRITR
jgi:acylphosphatase